MAAFLAKAGFDSSERAIEAPRGFANVLSTKQDYPEIIDGLGERWETALNTYKPFACGIVIHPTIDGCQQLRRELGASVQAIREVELTTHPLVLELTGKTAPKTGLEGKFSVFHAAATALLRGDGSPGAFTDEAVRDPEIVALRDRVTARNERASPRTRSGSSSRWRAVSGSSATCRMRSAASERPLADEAITEKFVRQSAPVMGEEATERLVSAAWELESAADVAAIARAAAAA